VDRKRLLSAIEIARRVRLGDVKWGDAAILADHVLWLASQVAAGEYVRAVAPGPVPQKTTKQALHEENAQLRAALEAEEKKVEMLEQLLALWHGARSESALAEPLPELPVMPRAKVPRSFDA